MEVNTQDIVDSITAQRNDALNGLAMANATIKALQRENEALKAPKPKAKKT